MLSMQRLRYGLLKTVSRNQLSRSFATSTIDAESYEKKYLLATYNSTGIRGKKDLVLTHGQGQYLYDTKGQKYLDFYAGIAVSGLGHRDPDWYNALVESSKNICHASNLFHTKAPLELAKTLVDNSIFDKVFFCNSGTEANEAAYKFARLHANHIAKGTPLEGKKYEMVAFKNSFHGRTAAALSLTYKPAIREPFLPLIPGISHGELNNLQQATELITDKTAAVFVEPIQGEGGVRPSSKEFLFHLRKLCDKHNALLIVDEIQCGLGRTGKLFAYENFVDENTGLTFSPDIMTLAKPLAGGLPIGACLTTNKVAETITPGTHGTTFGGNPIICAVAQTVLDKIKDPAFLKQVRENGKYLHRGLTEMQKKYPEKITELRGEHGLFVGIDCSKPINPLISYALDKRVLLITAGEKTIRLCPPLVVTKDDIDQVLSVLDEAFKNNIV